MRASLQFFKTEVIVQQIGNIDENTILFEIINKSIDPTSTAFEKIVTPFTNSNLSSSPNNLFFSVETLCEALPFHFIFKRNFSIIQMGNSLKRYARQQIAWTKKTKIMFSDLFIVIKPIIELNFETILLYSNHMFMLIMREEYIKGGQDRAYTKSAQQYSIQKEEFEYPKLRMKGQMISLPAFDSILFLGSPKVEDTDEMEMLDLTMSDFPVFDAMGRHIMARSTQSSDQDIIHKIDVAANHLKIVEKKLRIEIGKNHKILHEIFPAKIARILCQNIKVDAESFEAVTCLYSDIVNFTKMCSSSKMTAIDIVRLLNK